MFLYTSQHGLNTLRPKQNGHRFADDTFKRIFLNENARISINISLKFVPKGSINNDPALVQIMAWCRSGDKPLSESMMVSLPTHICVTRPQWVKQWEDAIHLYPFLRLFHTDTETFEPMWTIALEVAFKYLCLGVCSSNQNLRKLDKSHLLVSVDDALVPFKSCFFYNCVTLGRSEWCVWGIVIILCLGPNWIFSVTY